MVGVVVELHLFVVVIRLEVTVCSPCLCRLRRSVVAAETLTIHIVVIVLTIIWQVKCLVVVFNGLQLLCILVLVIDSQAISLIACIRNSSWVCTVTCKVAKLADDSLTTDVDVLGIFATLPSNQVWADIETEPCRTSVTTRELGVYIYGFILA